MGRMSVFALTLALWVPAALASDPQLDALGVNAALSCARISDRVISAYLISCNQRHY